MPTFGATAPVAVIVGVTVVVVMIVIVMITAWGTIMVVVRVLVARATRGIRNMRRNIHGRSDSMFGRAASRSVTARAGSTGVGQPFITVQ